MTEQAALLKAITAHADDDTPRLVFADWLDENKPDRQPSPAVGPSARAEFIRVQCRLAAGAFDAVDYPELLEREGDLATWLNTYDPDPYLALDDLHCNNQFEGGEWGAYRRGFPEVVDFYYGEDGDETVESLTQALDVGFAKCPARTLRLEDAMVDEIALLARHPSFSRVRGICLDYLVDGDEDEAVRAIALSPHAAGLRRLYFDFPIGMAGCKALALSHYLRKMESLVLDYPPVSAATIRALARAKWFRNLRRLQLWIGRGDVLRALADLPTMPRLISLTLRGSLAASLSSTRRFAESSAFPRLAHLDLTDCGLTPDHVTQFTRGRWPLRHLRLGRNEVRRVGCEAIAAAPFARKLRVLDLFGAEVTSGGAQALASAESLAPLKHLHLAENPIGPGGLAALEESPHLRGLRVLDLAQLNSARGPIGARDVSTFLTALDMPELRHLMLDLLPVGIRGAKLIATRPTFGKLTRLGLSRCTIGDAGARAITRSKRLTGLVSLDLSGNKIARGVEHLANRKVLPRLAQCRLGNGVPKSTAARLRRRPGVHV